MILQKSIGFLPHSRLGRYIRSNVNQAVAAKDVKTILLMVDSPGGSVDGLAEAGDAIFAARAIKPVTAQVEGMAASAAYYLASQASKIFAQRMDTVGSIGTRALVFDTSRAFDKAGIRAIPIDTGQFKSAGAPGVKVTDAQIAEFQRIVDAYYADFLSAIQRGRGMSKAQIKPLADGRLFMATEALSLGLIDGIRMVEETLQAYGNTRRRQQAVRRLQLAKAETETELALMDCEPVRSRQAQLNHDRLERAKAASL